MFLLKQSFNFHGFTHLLTVFKNPKLLLPDYYCGIEDVTNYVKAHNDGGKNTVIRGLIFDKDNTLTIPFNNAFYGADSGKDHTHFKEVIHHCQDYLGFENVVILSNSAGSSDDMATAQVNTAGNLARWFYPHADEVEKCLNIRVLRHGSKKPACAKAVYRYFNSDADISTNADTCCHQTPPKEGIENIQMPDLCMVGDRLLTDILFGNMHGCRTVLVDPIDESRDIPVVRLIRFLEMKIVIPLLCRYFNIPQLTKSTKP